MADLPPVPYREQLLNEHGVLSQAWAAWFRQLSARVGGNAGTDAATVASNLDSHITDTSGAHAASAISNSPSGNLAATNVQTALNELQSDVDNRATTADLNSHESVAIDAHAASAVGVTPSGNLSSDNVQDALEELQNDVDGLGALPAGISVPYNGSTAPSGWVLEDGGTIGNASSVATNRANADTEALFVLLWNSSTNTELPIQDNAGVATTRGASGAADFAANKRLPLPDSRSRTVVGAGTGTGLTARTLHSTFGAETHALTFSEMPDHTHGAGSLAARLHHSGGALRFQEVATGGWTTNAHVSIAGTFTSTAEATGTQVEGTSATATASSNGAAHANMQPSIAKNWITKL